MSRVPSPADASDSGLNLGLESFLTPVERLTMRECEVQAYRTSLLPALFGSSSVLFLAHARRVRPLWCWVAALGVGKLTFEAGRSLYIGSDECAQKFLDREPDGILAQVARVKRDLPQTSTEAKGKAGEIEGAENQGGSRMVLNQWHGIRSLVGEFFNQM